MFNPLKFKETLGLNTITAPSTTNTATTDIPEGTTLEQLENELLGLVAQENTNHYRMGQIYNCIRDRKLAQKAGYKDAKDFFSKKFADLSQTTLTLYGAVVESFTEPVSRRFGVTCLYLLLTYKEAADIEVNHEEPGDTPIEVPDEKGHVSTLPFKDCTVDQMRQALQPQAQAGLQQAPASGGGGAGRAVPRGGHGPLPQGQGHPRQGAACATRRARRCWTSRASPWSRPG